MKKLEQVINVQESWFGLVHTETAVDGTTYLVVKAKDWPFLKSLMEQCGKETEKNE